MKMIELRQFGFPEALIGNWIREKNENLLPLQEKALREFGIFEGKSLLISSPTSSGKTFVGELAAVRTALKGARVIYLLPLKALAEEKHLEFINTYGEYGMSLAISSRDHHEFDGRIERGEFDMAVIVYEKLMSILIHSPPLVSRQIRVVEGHAWWCSTRCR
ncbi:DEAD/DEAH box helicase [Candidatus Hydrogenedentota bacterium]